MQLIQPLVLLTALWPCKARTRGLRLEALSYFHVAACVTLVLYLQALSTENSLTVVLGFPMLRMSPIEFDADGGSFSPNHLLSFQFSV